MAAQTLFNKDIIQELRSAEKARVVQPVQVGETSKENELVFFIKPELLDIADDEKMINSFDLIEQKFKEFDVQIKGAVIVPGTVLEEHGIMNRHYGFINQLSREASKLVDPEIREAMFKVLGIEDNLGRIVLGGHEFLQTFETEIDTLSDVWFAQEANKLRSGFYFIEDTIEESPFILVNGFHPSQLQHYTRADHCIYLMLLHTDTDWHAMKFDLVGDTFPEKAKPNSIRGLLFSNPERYGQETVGINTNGVHLSAGPFEAAFEVVNFFGPLTEYDVHKTPPLILKKIIESGISGDKATKLLENPAINDSDLFSETENLNTHAAVELVKGKLFQAD